LKILALLNHRNNIVHLTILLLVLVVSTGQSQSGDVAAAAASFDQNIGIENSGIVNGPEYKMGQRGASSDPFFGSGATQGNILYDHQWYTVSLLYDEFQDEIVVKHFAASGRAWFVKLEKTRVQRFIIGDRVFVNFPRGFHEVIFDSPEFQVTAKRAKVSQIKGGIFNYIVNDEYFIVAADRWKPLRGTSGFVKMVDKDQRRAVKLYIQESKVRVRKFKSDELVKVARFVNSRST
jgi:hypothetical protein